MSSKTYSHMINSEIDVCADCNQTNPIWASINHGTLICDQCAIIHRSLGRFISQIKSLKSNNWKLTQLQMVLDLYRSGSNSIWEHTLLDPHIISSGSIAQTHIKGLHPPHSIFRKKPQPNDPLHPNKSDFIRAKYQLFAYVNKSHGMKDDVESESDISEQLHSSVRTPNLKTSLRLLVAGANPNYIHSEKFNSPLHMAARSGQMSQIELLLVYGANLSVVDSRNKSAIDYAREAGHNEIVYRLIEHQFDLSDTLTRFICQGRQPNHRNGEHFLIVDIKADFLDNTSNENDNKKRSSTEVFRNDLHQSIQLLSHKSFQELSRDVYDELDRREINSFVTSYYANDNGKLSIFHQQLMIPFLPVYQYFSTTRNQGRQKLALLNTKELTLLIVDVLNEIRRRIYKINSSPGSIKNDDTHNIKMINEFEDEDSEPLYDSVPSEEDYDECNELIINKIVPTANSNVQKSSATIMVNNTDKFETVPSKKDVNNFSMIEYTALKEQMIKSAESMEIFLNENKVMRLEINRLQSIVDKLVEENVQLRQLIIPSNQNSLKPFPNELKSNSMLIESTEHLNHNSCTQNTTNRVRPQSMSNHLNSNNNNNSTNNQQPFSNESLLPMKSPTNLNVPSLSVSPTKSSSSSIGNYFSSQQVPQTSTNNQRNTSPNHHHHHHHHHYNMVFNNPNESFVNSLNSSSSSLSSQIIQQQSVSLSSSSHQQVPLSTLNEINNQMRQYCQNSVSSGNHQLQKSASKSSLPTKDEVIKKIEYITNGIKELLIKAKEGKHDEFQHCSERICNHVSDMINLFPESIESSKIDNLLQLNQALIVLQTNVIQLHEECNSYENLPRFQHATPNQDNRYIYNTIIDKAAEVATSVKSIINLYTIQTNNNSNNNNANNSINSTNFPDR